ncbi:MAG TPA: RNA polymerase subunit sigma-70, partial [Ruminococcaceae bacterium]|nr:RNA polymerase subunit sigma-70 [Oscillospiraceae bacterium]
MEDIQIVEMYWERNESAISETQSKYGSYLRRIAYNILANDEDSGECENDTYYRAWESIPPNKPVKLSAYLSAITRNLAISLFRSRNTASRAGSQYALSLDELGECVS